ncbi:MAG: DUF4123 domain-containing protein [Marinobacter sp.]
MIAGLKGLSADAEQNRYILIDGALLDAPKLIYSHDDNPGFDQLYRRTPHQSALEVSPCIVQPSNTSRLWEAESIWRSAGVVIESHADIQTISDHFRSLVSVRLPDQTFVYLRFYSPTQIQGLLSAFNSNERAMFSGPVLKWHYFHSDTGWETVAINSLAQGHEAKEEGFFQLTDEHIQTITAQKEATFTRVLTKNSGLALTPDNESLMRKLIEQGRCYGFRTEAQLASYTEIATHYPKAICQSSAQSILSDAKRPASERLYELDSLMAQGGA